MAKVYTKEELNSFSRETLMAVILSMQDQISQLNTNMERLIEQIADANNKRYGRSSEKLETISGQMELELIFNEAEALTETLYVVEPAEEDVIQPRHRKSKGKREADLKDLPVEVISHTLSEEKLRDVFGTDGWKQLPDEIYKRVRVQPAVYTVEEHHVAVYAGRDNQTIIKADRPKDLLRNSLLTPSLAASIMNAKYVNGLPLYRISQEFLRNDIHISRQVMANWMIQCADRYLGILYDRLHRELYQFHVLQADETPVMVTKDGRPVNSKSYMWIYRTGKSYTDTPIILYEYQRTRKADHPEEFLKDFKGIVVCDGYSAYRKLDRENPDIVFAGCWSHARRRFAEALKALPKAVQKNAKETIAYEAVSRIAAIYHLDNQMEGQPAKARKMYRQTNIRPLVEADDFFKVCDVASAADLPHSGDSGLDCDSGTVVQLILFQLIGEDRAGSHKAHGASLCQLRNNFFSKISHKAQYYQLTLKISTKKEPLISQKSQTLRFYLYSISPNCTILA